MGARVQALSKIACSRLQKELAEWQVNPPAGFKHRVTDDLQRCPSAIVALPIPFPQQAIPAVRGLLDSFLRGSVLGYRFLVRESSTSSALDATRRDVIRRVRFGLVYIGFFIILSSSLPRGFQLVYIRIFQVFL
jgi:ubiquitin-conjugating enzyme E2 W